jgi:hypothetical protein
MRKTPDVIARSRATHHLGACVTGLDPQTKTGHFPLANQTDRVAVALSTKPPPSKLQLVGAS